MKSEIAKIKRRLERIEKQDLAEFADHKKSQPKPGKRDKEGEFWTNEQLLDWDSFYGYRDMMTTIKALHKIALEAIAIAETNGKANP